MSDKLQLNIEQCLQFLDMLRPHGRHTIASEAPFGGIDNGPRWESGATYEYEQRPQLIKDIQLRQKCKSNVYYSVNCPCHVSERKGANGKNNIDDIIAINALAFDIDFTSFQRDQEEVLKFINDNLKNELQPSLVINTGGGFHLIYFLNKKIITKLFRPAKTDEEKRLNEIMISDRSFITTLAHDFEYMLRGIFQMLPVKVDNMSNIDRVMRLPGTVNYPKAEKIAKGQSEALAHIAIDYHYKFDIQKLREVVPKIEKPRSNVAKTPFIPRKNSKWTAYKKALACCEFIRDEGLGDTNEWYTLNVMLPLIGAIHDENEANQLTIEEAEECFMEAISGGARYNTMGRGPGYFMRQWKSHRPELARTYGNKSLGGLIFAAKEAGMKLPWVDEVMWEEDWLKQKEELEAQRQTVSQADKKLFD
jgi:hypothetical protein